jgi:purine-nucleoside/S-methyl-5'-thioadenosine phosphorylase / adenosine deaminase
MPFHEQNGIRYFSFDIFPQVVKQAVFTRRGGVSPAPWDSLNVGGMVGDDIAHVKENRIRSFHALGRNPASIFDVWLVHSTDVICVDRPRDVDMTPIQADAILTDKPEVTLYMRYADCVPILFYDPVKGVVGMAHAGWMGTVRGMAKATIQKMQFQYACKPENILAAVGPSIGADHYEIGPDVIMKVKESFGEEEERLLESRNGRVYLDLWLANYIQLQQSGVEKIEVSGVCTACHLDDWFSHRAEKGKTGRFGALIGMRV